MKSKFKKLFILSAVAGFVLFFNGCGYQLGSIMHPQVKSIAIGAITSETMEINAIAYMRQALAEQFNFDGSIKVKGEDEADCILYGRILKATTKASSHDSYDGEQRYVPAEWIVEIQFEFVVLVPGRTKALINNRQVVGTATYQVMADQDIVRRAGVQQACRNAAVKVVTYTTEAW